MRDAQIRSSGSDDCLRCRRHLGACARGCPTCRRPVRWASCPPRPLEFETLLYSVDGAVATITLNRPERLNTIVPPMPDEVEAAVGGRSATPSEGHRAPRRRPCFCAGYDFGGGFHHWGEAMRPTGEWDPGKDFAMATAPEVAPTQKFMSIWRSPKPVIAQVHGWCVGGGSDFALCADLVIASEDARHRHALQRGCGAPTCRACGSTGSAWREAKFHALTGRPLNGRRGGRRRADQRGRAVRATRRRVAALAARARHHPELAAGRDEVGGQPCLREHGVGLDPDARPDPRRPDAQHARRAGLHRARRPRGRARASWPSATARSATTARPRRSYGPTRRT